MKEICVPKLRPAMPLGMLLRGYHETWPHGDATAAVFWVDRIPCGPPESMFSYDKIYAALCNAGK